MSTDWDKELAKIDKQLNSIPDEELKPTPPAKAGAKAPPPAAGAPLPSRMSRRQAFGVFARLALAIGLGVGLLFWPYASRCGAGLAIYLGALGITLGAGVWSAVAAWRHRAAKTHLVSLLVIAWAIGLGAREILPRIGYARPDLGFPTTWMCE
ncbi:MAG TPA: hypothetical protein VJ803_01365 [Gemmatimonadaceae bacterium]|nr:hypothetical protein [Gemmatimonadaceae bacterium]